MNHRHASMIRHEQRHFREAIQAGRFLVEHLIPPGWLLDPWEDLNGYEIQSMT